MAKNIIEVTVSNLELDQENARFESQIVASQRDAIQHLLSIDNMADKVAQLAEHIARNGDDPSELPLVILNPNKEKTYIVVEGNRRVLALKLLRNPSLCPPGQKALQKKLNLILSKYVVPTSLKKIQCSLLENRKEANLWIELKHTGENGGAGRVEWDGNARDAFREKQGAAKTVGRVVLEYIAEDSDFDEDLKAYSKSISITNLTRLFGSSEAMSNLGYSISGGKIIPRYSKNIFRRGMEAVIFRFREDDVKVGDIYDSATRQGFFEKRIDPADLPIAASLEELAATNPKSTEPEVAVGTDADDSGSVIKTAGAKRKSAPASNLRKNLINFTLRISQNRINNIYLELKNKLNVTETPNAASVLFRVFLELTTDYGLTKLRLNTKAGVSKESKLRNKIDVVIDKLFEKSKLEKKEVDDLKRLTGNVAFQAGTVDGLHSFIHGPNHPLAKELNDMMDNWAPFFLALWAYDVEFNAGTGQRPNV